MKNRTKLIAGVCGMIVLLGMLIAGGRRLFGLNLFLGGFGTAVAMPEMSEMPQIPDMPDMPDVGNIHTFANFSFSGMEPCVNGIPVDTAAKDAGDRELEAYETLQVDVNDAYLKLIPSDRYRIKYCYFTDLRKLIVDHKDGVLKLRDEYNEKYVKGNSGISMSGTWNIPDDFIEIYYPKDALFDTITLNDSYGDAELGAVKAQTLTLSLHNGDGSLKNVYAKKLSVACDYGDLSIENQAEFAADSVKLNLHSGDLSVTRLSSTGKMEIAADYGQVALKEIKAPVLEVVAHSGDVDITDTNGGKMSISADYGDVNLQRFIASQLLINCSSGEVTVQGNPGNDTKIDANYGDVTLMLPHEKTSYHYKVSTDYGYICVDGETAATDDGEDADRLEENTGAPNSIVVNCSSGNVELTFNQ